MIRFIIILIGINFTLSCTLQPAATDNQDGNKIYRSIDQCPEIISSSYDEFKESVERCESNPNCKLVYPGGCYCPPEMQCICGGGPPPICVLK